MKSQPSDRQNDTIGLSNVNFLQTSLRQLINPEDKRKKVGDTDDVVTLSLGVEDPEDLIEDLKHPIIYLFLVL